MEPGRGGAWTLLGQHHRQLLRLVSPLAPRPSGEVDWRRVSQLARRWRLSGLLLSRLKTEHQVPEPILAQIRLETLRQGAVTLKAMHALREITNETNSQQFPLILLKGARAVRDLYQNPAQRVMADLDILVRAEDFDRFQATLLGLGFEAQKPNLPKTEYHKVFTRGQVVVEAHWAFGGGVNASADIWQRTVRLEAPGVFGLGAEDRLLYLCHHICRHQMMAQPYHYCDLAYFLAKFASTIDYELLGRLAPEWPKISGMRLVLAVLTELFPELDTKPAREALGEESFEEGLVVAATRSVLAPAALIGRARRMSQRRTTPSLLWPDELMRTIHGLSEGDPVSWRHHLQTFLKRATHWLSDRRKLSRTPQFPWLVQEQARLLSWLSGSQP